jgi:peptidoglycan/xylan/chitin deacetylase (PgdA/CDA1 family)
MTDDMHPWEVARQRFVATVCVTVLAIIYLAGYVQFHKLISAPQQNIAAAQLAGLTPSLAPGRLLYAPDVVPPIVRAGLAPVIARIPTNQPVVFLTIDDGAYKEPEAAAKMRAADVPASLFLTQRYIGAQPGYFSNIATQTGSVIENHTLDHKDLHLLSYEDQKAEICGTNDIYAKVYGKRPTIMRPPYGSYNENTQRAAAACGLRGIIIWKALVQNGAMEYQATNSLHPGDIVLMHFTPAFKQDLQAFIAASKTAGLQPQLLEDWLEK